MQGAAQRVADCAGDIDTMRGSPYAKVAYSYVAAIRLLDDALLPIREYRVL